MENCGTALHARYLDLIKIIGKKVNTFPYWWFQWKHYERHHRTQVLLALLDPLTKHSATIGFVQAAFCLDRGSLRHEFIRTRRTLQPVLCWTHFFQHIGSQFSTSLLSKKHSKRIVELHKQKATQTNKRVTIHHQICVVFVFSPKKGWTHTGAGLKLQDLPNRGQWWWWIPMGIPIRKGKLRDGSEIPNNHPTCMKPRRKLMVDIYRISTGDRRISEPSNSTTLNKIPKYWGYN